MRPSSNREFENHFRVFPSAVRVDAIRIVFRDSAESFIPCRVLRTARAGRSAEDRLLCKQEALGSNPSRSIASFSTKDLTSDGLPDLEMSAMGEETNVTANNSTAAWRAILEDPDVQEWHETMGLKKTGTADERGRVLFRYCKAL